MHTDLRAGGWLDASLALPLIFVRTIFCILFAQSKLLVISVGELIIIDVLGIFSETYVLGI